MVTFLYVDSIDWSRVVRLSIRYRELWRLWYLGDIALLWYWSNVIVRWRWVLLGTFLLILNWMLTWTCSSSLTYQRLLFILKLFILIVIILLVDLWKWFLLLAVLLWNNRFWLLYILKVNRWFRISNLRLPSRVLRDNTSLIIICLALVTS
jgi:hypothetical protein